PQGGRNPVGIFALPVLTVGKVETQPVGNRKNRVRQQKREQAIAECSHGSHGAAKHQRAVECVRMVSAHYHTTRIRVRTQQRVRVCVPACLQTNYFVRRRYRPGDWLSPCRISKFAVHVFLRRLEPGTHLPADALPATFDHRECDDPWSRPAVPASAVPSAVLHRVSPACCLTPNPPSSSSGSWFPAVECSSAPPCQIRCAAGGWCPREWDALCPPSRQRLHQPPASQACSSRRCSNPL